jgi:hypothetical protein
MTEFEHDPVMTRAIDALRTLPDVDARMIQRVVQAAGGARVGAAEDDSVRAPRYVGRLGMIAGVAAAAAVAGFLLRGAVVSRESQAPPPASAPTLRAASATDAQSMPVPEQFVFESATARRVSLVGDFNDWNPSATPLVREPGSATWSVVLPVAPGRHIYAFMVDSALTLDPRRPTAKDPVLGVDGSVLMVVR